MGCQATTCPLLMSCSSIRMPLHARTGSTCIQWRVWLHLQHARFCRLASHDGLCRKVCCMDCSSNGFVVASPLCSVSSATTAALNAVMEVSYCFAASAPAILLLHTSAFMVVHSEVSLITAVHGRVVLVWSTPSCMMPSTLCCNGCHSSACTVACGGCQP